MRRYEQDVLSHPEHAAANRSDGTQGAGPAAFDIDWNDPSNDDVIAFVESQYEAGKVRRMSWEAQASECLAYAAGSQNMRWSPEARDLVERFVDHHVPERHRQAIQINTIKGFVLHRMSLLLGVPITWDVLPWSEEDRDINQARLSTKILQHTWGNADPDFLLKLIDALWQLFCTGVVFAKVWWDPDMGADRIFYPKRSAKGSMTEKIKEFADRIGEKLGRKPELTDDGGFVAREGDNHIEFCTGFEITEPVMMRRVHECPWLIYSTFLHREKIAERFGDDFARKCNPDVTNEAYHAGYARMYGYERRDGIDDLPNSAESEMVLVHELWRPKSRRNPKGFMGVVASGNCAKKGPNPYRHGRMPFVEMRELPDDRFRPASTVRMLLTLQDARNRNRTKIAEWINRTTDPAILAQKGVNLPDNAFTANEPQILEVADVNGVKAWEPPRLPNEAMGLDQRYEMDMQTVAGVHDSSLGRMESAQQSGKHAELLQASDQRGNTVTRLLLQTSLQEIGRLVLWNTHQYASGERLIRIGGTYAEREVVAFTGADLMPERKKGESGPYSFNVTVDIGQELNMEVLLDKVQFLIESGLLDPKNPDDQMTLHAMIGDKIVRDDDGVKQRSRASQENRQILKGQEAILARGDDDRIHIKEHESFTITPEFREAAAKDPTLVPAMEAHIRQHLMQDAEKRLRPGMIDEVTKVKLMTQYQEDLGLDPQQGVGTPTPAGGRVPGGEPSQGGPTPAPAGQGGAPRGGLRMAM